MGDPAKLQFVLDLAPTASTTSARRAGYENDLIQFAAIDSLELDAITVPTLVRARPRRRRPAAGRERLRG